MRTEGATVADAADRQFEWLLTTNPDAALAAVCPRDARFGYGGMARRGMLSPPAYRRLQLFGCACARLVWDLLPTDARNGVAIRERYAQGRASEADLRACSVRMPEAGGATARAHALASAAHAVGDVIPGSTSLTIEWYPTEAARRAAKALATRDAGPAPPGGNPVAVEWQLAWNSVFQASRAHQAELVRDIFPPPGYAPALDRDWLTDTVLAIARQADESGDYSALPILADALQDAGCNNEVVLDRCRATPAAHCRGNWVVDLLLGRE